MLGDCGAKIINSASLAAAAVAAAAVSQAVLILHVFKHISKHFFQLQTVTEAAAISTSSFVKLKIIFEENPTNLHVTPRHPRCHPLSIHYR